jgi:pyrroline-5-carboxylate reductase
MAKVGFIGSGNMGTALAKAASLADSTKVYLYDKDEAKATAAAKEIGADFTSAERIAKECDFIFLAVKPNIIPVVAKELKEYLSTRKGYTVVSMAAGVSIASLEEYFAGVDAPIIRIMPNTPAAIGAGMMLWSKNDKVSFKAASSFEKIMAKSGTLDAIDEKLIDAASAVSGCGPAFVYMFIEALADGAVECGLPRDKALKYAEQTVLGAAKTALAYGQNPAALKDAVCSPGGTTIAGVHALENGAFRATVMNCVNAAYEKTLKIGK